MFCIRTIALFCALLFFSTATTQAKSKNKLNHNKPTITIQKLQVMGGSKERIHLAILANQRKLMPCYRKALRKNKNLKGEITLSWTLNHMGKAQSVRTFKSLHTSKKVSTCMQKSIKKWSFPIFLGTGKKFVVLSLALSPKKAQKQPAIVQTGRTLIRGSLSKKQILRTIHSRMRQLQVCYRRALQDIPLLEGRLQLRLLLERNGLVQKAKIFNSNLRLLTLERCILRNVRRWHFPKPKGGGPVIVIQQLFFRTTPSTGKTTRKISTAKGSLSQKQIQEVINKNRKKIRYCYSQALTRMPGVKGKLYVRFLVDPQGRVRDLKFVKNTLNFVSMEHCLIRRLIRFRFPSPSGGYAVVRYPLIFKNQ